MESGGISRNLKQYISIPEQNTGLSVGQKILFPFFLVTIIVIASLSYFVVAKISDKMEEMALRRAVVVLESTIQSVEDERRTVETYAHLLGDSLRLEQALRDGNKEVIYSLLISSKQFSGQQKIVIFDSKGEVVVQVANSTKIHQAGLELLKKGLAGITTSTLTVTDNGLDIYAVTPIHSGSANNEKSPVMLLDRHLGETELKAIKKREGVDITLISDNRVAASTLNTTLADKILRDIINSKGEQLRTKVSVDNKEYVNVWKPIGNQGLISVMVPNDDLTAIKAELSEHILWTTVMAALLVLACAAVITRLMVGPLQRMLKITKAITGGDFSQKIEVSSRDEFGELGEAINYMAERVKERLDTAEHLATIDGLTGLYNHRFFQQRLGEEIQRAERNGSSISLIILDIDYFKHYNDILGHPAGDKVLQQIGRLLRRNIRSVDIAARYGGEEFALILVDSGARDAFDVGERIRLAVEDYPFEGREEQPSGRVTVSLGIASYPENAVNKEELVKLADDALYKAKYISKNKVVLYYSVLDELKNDLDKSEHDLLNTVKTLISVINSRDKYTYGHSERVVQYASTIAGSMGLTGAELRNIKVAAFLHDIGKIEIGREVLNKEGQLTPDEMDILRQHPSWGAQIVSSIKSLKDVVPIILYHHEKYDGTGYPAGLKDGEIPIPARILKVADSFDAMTSFRPYQPTKTYKAAREELLACAGRDFDPLVVDVFLKALDEYGSLWGES